MPFQKSTTFVVSESAFSPAHIRTCTSPSLLLSNSSCSCLSLHSSLKSRPTNMGPMSVHPSTKSFFPIPMKFGVQVEVDESCTMVCRMTRSKVKFKVTKPLKLEILHFSKSISSGIFNVSWQMTTDSETTEQYLTFVRSRFLICPSSCVT